MTRRVSATVVLALLAAWPAWAAPASPTPFATADQAAKAIISASGAYDVPKMLAIFGPDSKDFVASADPVRDKRAAQTFASLAREKYSLAMDGPNKAVIVVGDEAWPMPVPIVKRNGAWYFDAGAGRQEILDRRIGSNELDAIQVCRGYVEAQRDYAQQTHGKSGVYQYAQRIESAPGTQDGLYWKNPDGSGGGPIGSEVAKALAEGYRFGGKTGYHGYYFKILKAQGPDAPMGQLNYVIEGLMIGGFALAAVPAEYGVTGLKTFIVNNDGIVYQRDLGPNSLAIVRAMTVYNPGKGWQITNSQWPSSATSKNPPVAILGFADI